MDVEAVRAWHARHTALYRRGEAGRAARRDPLTVHADPCLLLPRPGVTRPAHLLSMARWEEKYAYYLDCMVEFLKQRVQVRGPASMDWEGVRTALVRYAYRTSSNRHRAFEPLK